MANLIEFDLAEVERLAAQGLTQAQIADSLGVSTRTVGTRMADSAEFAEAVKRGAAQGVSEVSNILMEHARSGNVVAAIFYLKCKGGFRETQNVELSGGVRVERIEHVIVDPQK